MTVVTRSVLWKKDVPRGWKTVSLRQGSVVNSYYLSPEGKRFATLEAAKEHIAIQLADMSDTEGNEFIHSPRRRKRKFSGGDPPSAKRLKFDETVTEEENHSIEPLSLPIEIQRRRKLMAARSPFRNLLKRTLVRNHVRLHGRGTWKAKAQVLTAKSPVVVNAVPVTPPQQQPNVKRVKCYDPPTPERTPPIIAPSKFKEPVVSELQETPPKSKQYLEETPPRVKRRQSMMFTPPNLTPPVSRRSSGLTSSSPNQRNFASKANRLVIHSQPNFNV